MSNGKKRLTLNYTVVKQFSSDTPRDENILPWTILTWKYPAVNFSQTMVLHTCVYTYIYVCAYIIIIPMCTWIILDL